MIPLTPPAAGLVVTDALLAPDVVILAVTTTARSAPCPGCRSPSDHVHSRYVRTVADLPWLGRRVVHRITVRKFRCRTVGCPRAVFCERLPGFVAPYARTSGRLAEAHRAIGFAAGGEGGSRLADRLALPASPDTLLRRMTAIGSSDRPTPRALGVDDFAFRKGHTYGTILVDLGRQRVVDLLPDRTADTLAAWLRAHPGIELVTRDRAPAYAQGITAGAPNATQVADRFHLLVNVREAVEQVLARHADAVAAALTDPPKPPSSMPAPVDPPSPYAQRKQAASEGRRTRRAARYAEVLRLREAGTPIRDIASACRMSSATILRYLKTGSVPTGSAGRPGRSRLDPFRPYLDEQLAAGCRNARTLHHELRDRGFTGGYETVRRAVQSRTGVDGRKRTSGPLVAPATPIPSARKLSFGVMRQPDRRSESEAECVHRLGSASDPVAAAVHLGEPFAAAVRSRDGIGLDAWLTAAGASDLAEFRGLAGSMREDLAAVRAGVVGPQSNGPVEGAVNRLKTIKRSMYGRAGFALLKARVLFAG